MKADLQLCLPCIACGELFTADVLTADSLRDTINAFGQEGLLFIEGDMLVDGATALMERTTAPVCRGCVADVATAAGSPMVMDTTPAEA